ncbi:MAG TPA: trypsin-like peptidase domain-containing protein [Bacillota bacterium]|jgi:Do/DeqQ family serine protease|nr:trypsin-like peptidase domain-containing protein [Peptococcaceae bacterium MAG4]NLW38339.1 PDZ domain-containing protein [Peptococcaceae bacterium]HPU35954.1 trypsin-like peptidase domain-containing protein [Bacillota bacterium]HPZ42990.1 trypsin-like peptidase domain-containing protein [Bacillota bacterium]HQD75378.1 trypsin-like peptidase domain-containing protein [Bacillota bacterium]
MKGFIRLPGARILGAFLAGMLLVAAAVFVYNLYGLPHQSWAEDNGLNALAAAPLPGLGPDTIPDIVARVSPAVVRIDTIVKSNTRSYNPLFDDPFFRHFFGDQLLIPSQPEVKRGMGSGFIVSSDGYILTNEHVISGADTIEVTLATRSEPYQARLVGSDHDLDLAVLKIDASGLPALSLGDSDSTRVGDWAIAIGNPYGLDHTVTIGVISAKGRPVTIEDRRYRNLLQTDASINPGNSGGPLLNLKGEVIGINTAINAQAQGIGFAIPSSTVKAVFDDLVNKGGVQHAWLGVYLQQVTQEIARYLGLESQSGALVASVVNGGPAAKAGLQQGDVIVRYNGSEVSTPSNLIDLVSDTAIGSQVEIQFIRKGETRSTIATIEARK